MSKAKLFLSYGRADAESVAIRIKLDLEKLDYEVWMDRNEIKAGSAYMEEIEENLKQSNAVIALMSPHSVRSVIDGSVNDSVCLDELAYARDYPGKILPVMVSKCRVPIVLYRLDYVDLCSWEQNEEEYQHGLKRVVEGIESTLNNEIHYRTTQEKLQPWDFRPFLDERCKCFVGRHWLFSEVIQWLEGTHHERALLIAADPGVGKSAFVGKWICLNPGGHLLAYHCCQIDSPTTLQPYCFIQSLAAMISSQIPEYEAMLKETNVEQALNEKVCREDPDRGLEQGIIAPLLRLNPPEDGLKCIIIDALDEAILLKGGKTIVDLLQTHLHRFPEWLRFIATTRNDPSVLKKLSGLRAQQFNAQDSRNIEDAKVFLEMKFSEKSMQALLASTGTSQEVAVGLLLQRSKGNFLYIHYALEGLLTGSFHLDCPDEFPPGLTGFYEKAFKYRFVSEHEYQPVAGILAVLLAAREPVDEATLFRASGLSSETQLLKYLKSLAVYLRETDKTYTFFHRSFAEWLRDKNNLDYHIEPMDGEAKLAAVGWDEYKNNNGSFSRYMQKYLPFHLIATGRYEQLTEILTDLNILEIVMKEGREHEWMRHWRLIMDKVELKALYQKSIEKYALSHPDLSQVAKASSRVGALLRDIGLHESALPFAQKAVQLIKEMPNPDKEELASALLILAELYRHLCEFDSAEPLYLESLHLREEVWPDSIEVAEVVYALCVFYNTCVKRDIDKSIFYNDWAIRIQQKQSPLIFASLADAINDKGILLEAKGKREEALPYYEEARRYFEQGFPEGHPELAVVLTNIGQYYYDKKEFQKALDLNIQGLNMRSMFVVPYDKKCMRFRRDCIKYSFALSKYAEAQKWAEEVIRTGNCGSKYPIKDKVSDMVMLGYATIYSDDATIRDRNFKEIFALIRKEPDLFNKPEGQEIITFFNFMIKSEMIRERFEGALSYNTIFVKFMTELDPQPYKGLAAYYNLLADIFHEIEAKELEDQARETAKGWEESGDERIPYLILIYQADEALGRREFAKSRQFMTDVFTAALIREIELKDWKPYLSGVANGFAIRLKNDYNEYEEAEWYYHQGALLDPGNGLLLGNYAFLLTSVLGKHEEAETYYAKALELDHDDANCLSNSGVFQMNIKKDFEKAEELFVRAKSLQSEHNDSILSNYATLKIVNGELDTALKLAAESYSVCQRKPDRIMVRSLFCAAAITAIEQKDYSQYLAQIKTLFLMGIQRVPWQANVLIENLKIKLPAKDFLLLEALWLAICNKENDLEMFEAWSDIRPMPLDRPWQEI